MLLPRCSVCSDGFMRCGCPVGALATAATQQRGTSPTPGLTNGTHPIVSNILQMASERMIRRCHLEYYLDMSQSAASTFRLSATVQPTCTDIWKCACYV